MLLPRPGFVLNVQIRGGLTSLGAPRHNLDWGPPTHSVVGASQTHCVLPPPRLQGGCKEEKKTKPLLYISPPPSKRGGEEFFN